MANAAVAAVKKGCQLYKDIKGAVGNVKEIIDDLDQQFHKKHEGKKITKEAVAQLEQEKQRVKSAAQTDPNDVITQIGDQLGEFFDIFDKWEQYYYEEEAKSKEVYTGSESIAKRALLRELRRTRMEKLEAELRELLVYNSPPELGDLWTRFEAMKDKIVEEQTVARAKKAQLDREAAWRRRRLISALQDKAIYAVVVVSLMGYAGLLMWLIVLDRRTRWGF